MPPALSTPPSSNEPENVGWALLQPGAYAFYSTMLGVAQETLTYPLDVIKTRQQHDVSPRTRSGRDIFRELWHTEGVRGLYRGYLANSVGSWPGQVVYFGGYEFCKHTLGQLTGLPTEDSEDVQGTGSSPRDSLRRAFVSLTSGCLAETIALLIHQPADVISQRQMVATYRREVDRVDLRRDIRARDIIRAVVRHEGLRGRSSGWRKKCYFAGWQRVWRGAVKVALKKGALSGSRADLISSGLAYPSLPHPQAFIAAILHQS